MNEKSENRLLIGLVIITTAICLRAPITSVGSILYCIAEDLNLSNTVSGTITTIPLVVMAVLSPFIGRVGEKLGLNRALLVGMTTMVAGILLRSFGGFAGLLIGTALIGAGITFGNVLVPAIIKTFFPDKIGTMTGAFTTTMSICSGIGAGISVPLAVGMGWGWQSTFCIWAVMATVAIFINLIQIRRLSGVTVEPQKQVSTKKVQPLYKRPRVWAMVMLFGGQSCVFFVMATWLPTIIIDKGISAVTAGVIATVFQVSAIPANFGVPILASHIKEQRVLSVGVPLLAVIGLFGIMFTDSFELLAVSAGLLSLGLGGTFSLSLVLFGMRTRTGAESARLSGFSQSAGYVMAAAGPTLTGMIYDFSHNWTLPIAAAIVVMLMSSMAGFTAGTDEYI